MAKKNIKIAIAYDFDGTLAPGNMQEHSFIPKLGINKSAFWAEVKEKAEINDMNEILAYMHLMLEDARGRGIWGTELTHLPRPLGLFKKKTKEIWEKNLLNSRGL